jgi:toxin-antitoxin system PIN domain toxin
VTAFLFDVNLLIALMWPAHEDHGKAQEWFAHNAHEGWATCPFTQAAFVRIVANPAFSSDAPSPLEAAGLLASNLKHQNHHFWADEITLSEAIKPFSNRLSGHQQVTDAYLLGLAIYKKGKLVTMDRAVTALLPAPARQDDFLEII